MDLKNQKIREQNRDMTIKLIPLVAIIAKILHVYVLPIRYFYDSWRMVGMLRQGEEYVYQWTGYQATVNFYKHIDFFKLSTPGQWSVAMGLALTPLLMIMVSRVQEMGFKECIFTLMATGILNIYVFGITKEVVQLLFFVAIYLIISLPINNTFIKLAGCAGVFYWESLFYRSYYIIMAAMVVFVYFVFMWLKKREQIRKKHVFGAIVGCFLAIFIFLFVSQFISAKDFHDAINIRDLSVNIEANTAIINPIEVNSNYGIFMFDYVLAAFRMMAPIELLIKGPAYAPFVVYQFFILYYYIKTLINIKKLDAKMVVVISSFTAYIMGSFVFEPDFGSWVRHEASTFPILQMMAYNCHIYDEEKSDRRLENYETADA